MNNDYWFYIEPYVYICKNQKSILIYNTLNGVYKEYPNELHYKEIIDKINLPRNNRVITLTSKDLDNSIINDFIYEIREIHAGDLLKKEWSKKKPIQMTPILNLQSDVEYFKTKEAQWIGDGMMNNIYELTLYINNYSSNSRQIWDNGYKQILLPYSENENYTIKFSEIKKLIKQVYGSSLSTINIIGGNLFLHPEIDDIIHFFNMQNKKIVYHIDDADLIDSIKFFNKIETANSSISISVLPDSQNINEFLKFQNITNIDFKFVIDSEDRLFHVEKTIEVNELQNYSLFPLFNTKYIEFFKENVYVSKSEIFDIKHCQLDFFQKEKINTNFFGKITILANGNAYSNINEQMLGNIYEDSLYDIIYNEMYHGNSWLKTRKKVAPCKRCLYNQFCPPISNYEYVIGQFNLCSVTQ